MTIPNVFEVRPLEGRPSYDQLMLRSAEGEGLGSSGYGRYVHISCEYICILEVWIQIIYYQKIVYIIYTHVYTWLKSIRHFPNFGCMMARNLWTSKMGKTQFLLSQVVTTNGSRRRFCCGKSRCPEDGTNINTTYIQMIYLTKHLYKI